MKVGLDFGTTNSVVSFWDEGTKDIKLFEYKNRTSTPTAVLYGFQEKSVDIGENATDAWANDYSLTLARFFKTELNSLNKSQDAIKHGSEFIKNLLKEGDASFEQNLQRSITELVVSVPELWQKDASNIGSKNLITAIKNTGLHLAQLVSEPLSAVAYFAWKNPQLFQTQKKILVCDMGGGTSDISYCTAEKDNDGKISIDVIVHDGTQGKSGVYDLHKILEGIYKQQRKNDLINTNDFKKDIWQLDKLMQSQNVCDAIKDNYHKFLQNPENSINLFKFNQLPVQSELVYSAFPEIEKNIHGLLDKIKQSAHDNLDFDYLLFIGGFSNYFLVRESILNYFKLNNESEKVKYLPLNDSIRAVSYGATLIAAKQVVIRERYPHTVVINALEVHTNQPIEVTTVRAKDFINPNEVIWCTYQNNIHVNFEMHDVNEILVTGAILKNGNNNDKVFFSRKIPFQRNKNLQYRVGIKINRSNIATLVIKSRCGSVNVENEIGNLI